MGTYAEFIIILCAHYKFHSHMHAWILPCVLKSAIAVYRIMSSCPTLSGSISFVVDSVIRDYHIYKDIWPNPVVEKQLQCKREVGNLHDPIFVAVKKPIDRESNIVGHVPRQYLFCVQFLLEQVDLSLASWMAQGAIQPIYLKVAWNCLVN